MAVSFDLPRPLKPGDMKLGEIELGETELVQMMIVSRHHSAPPSSNACPEPDGDYRPSVLLHYDGCLVSRGKHQPSGCRFYGCKRVTNPFSSIEPDNPNRMALQHGKHVSCLPNNCRDRDLPVCYGVWNREMTLSVWEFTRHRHWHLSRGLQEVEFLLEGIWEAFLTFFSQGGGGFARTASSRSPFRAGSRAEH